MNWIKVVSFLFLSSIAIGQDDLLNSKSAILLHFGIGYHLPDGDLSERFGGFGLLEGNASYLFPSGQWMISAGYGYHYGNSVKEDVLAPLRNERGNVVGADGFPADIFLRQRAYSGHLRLNYLWSLTPEGKNDLSLVLGAGLGYIQHWIRLQDERNTARQLIQPYEAGYDRKTRGFTTNQYIGIQYLQANRRVNFYVGFEFVQAYTQSIRPWDFDIRRADTDRRLDLLNGARVGWILPLYLDQNAEVIYY